MVKQVGNNWQWQYDDVNLDVLNKPNIPLDNVATALTVLHLLEIELTNDKVNQFISHTKVAGRTELFKADCDVILDVAHNPQAARYLASHIMSMTTENKYHQIIGVVGMLADKDIINTLLPMSDVIDDWYIGELSIPRTASSKFITKQLTIASTGTKLVNCFDNIAQAFKMASQNSNENDLIVVFGSFYTVAEIRRLLI